METGAPLARSRAIPGGVGVSALGSKVRDYNIPGMPFRVHQFGTPVPSLRSSQPRARALLPPCPSRLLAAVRSVPDEREALVEAYHALAPPPSSPPRLCARNRETSERPDPFQEGPGNR